MTDDIVTRLRNWHDQLDSWQTLTEAADEIERLRASVINTSDNAFDEIERLRAELKRQSLQANIMRNVAMVPYGDSAGVIEELMADRDRWAVMAERLYDIMLAHESVSDDDWNQGIEDCHKLMMGDVRATNNSNP